MRVFLLALAMLTFCSWAQADAVRLERTITKHQVIQTFCIDGYKFVLARGNLDGQESPSIVQFYEEKDGKALPAKC